MKIRKLNINERQRLTVTKANDLYRDDFGDCVYLLDGTEVAISGYGDESGIPCDIGEGPDKIIQASDLFMKGLFDE